jgi:hypothetical protein
MIGNIMNKIVILILISNIFLINLFGDETDKLIKTLERIQDLKAKKKEIKKTPIQKLNDKQRLLKAQYNLSKFRAKVAKDSFANTKAMIKYTLSVIGNPITDKYALAIISKIQIGKKRIIIVNNDEYNLLVKKAISQAKINKQIDTRKKLIKNLQNIKDNTYIKKQLLKFSRNTTKNKIRSSKIGKKTKEIVFIGNTKKISSRVNLKINDDFLEINVK